MARRLSLNFPRWGALVIMLFLCLSMINGQGTTNTTTANTTATNTTTTNTTTNTTGTTNTTTNTTGTTNTTTNTTGTTNTTTTNTTTNTTGGTNTTTNTTGGASTTQPSSLVFNTIKTSAAVVTAATGYASYTIKSGNTSYFYLDMAAPTAATANVPMKIFVAPSLGTGQTAFGSLTTQAAYQGRGASDASVAMTQDTSTGGQVSYTAPAKDGYYMLSLKNTGSTDQTITVKFTQTNNTFLSAYSMAVVHHASTDPALKSFEMFVNNSQSNYKTYVELDSCVGDSLLYFSTVDSDKIPTNQTIRLANNVLLKRFESALATGTYYLYVQPVEFLYTAGGVNYATYVLGAETIFANESVPATYYRPGNNGQVYFKVNDGAGTQLNVNWTPFTTINSAYVFPAGTSTAFNVIASPSKAKVTSIVNCGAIILPSTAAVADSNISKTTDVQVSSTTGSALLNLQANTAYYIGVYGTVSGWSISTLNPGPQSIPYGVFYYQSPQPGSSGSSTDGAVAALIAIDVILFVVCIILGAIIYKMFYSKSAEGGAGSQYAAQGGNSASGSSSKNKYRV